MPRSSPLEAFHPAVAEWFSATFPFPTLPQKRGWPPIARGESTLMLAPTGSGKTLAAFLWCLNRLMFSAAPPAAARCRVIYVSPLKALAVDVERNLRAPLSGIAAVATARQCDVVIPEIAIRTGDTPAADRARFGRTAADILITTPESLFLLLTSNARARLATVETVIIDEIHALVPSKRGAHLMLSLERLEALRPAEAGPLQRIGLSATQRPLDEVARFLGGAQGLKPRPPRPHRRAAGARPGTTEVEAELRDGLGEPRGSIAYRPVTIVNASEKKQLALRIEVPVEDMARLPEPLGPPLESSSGPGRVSIWTSVQPRLLELIRAHRSTLLFVNSRRLAERLAGALNDLAGELLVRSHHGSLAREARSEVEELLKAGRIRALVATSSLELGIDMGAIDLVVQIEAPPSVASGMQRIGRAGHQAGAVSEGIIFPKFRGDLLACAAVSRAMHEGTVETTHYPRNPLDVLAQHVVAMTAVETWSVDELFARIRQAAPFAELSRRIFDGVLDMLSGRYPSDEFAELRPRLTWDRVRGTVAARTGAKRVAIANAGTIPDRGLYGVFLAGADRPMRVGELDEEMVFETDVGETFTLGASTWRVEDISHDRVLVSPAPGEAGKTPFWHGDQAGRPVELGRSIGALVRDLRSTPKAAAIERLTRFHDLERGAAENVLRYLDDQALAGGVPDDRTLVIERCVDDLGDWRVCVLSPLGSRIHAPWAMAVTALVRSRTGIEVEVMWGDEGFVVRFPEVEQPPDPGLMLPDPDEVEGLVMRQLGATSLFAARFRETAARSLLLPRRRPGRRTPLWQQRKRASDLLAVASRFGSFPAVLETYRELLRDHFDMAALVDLLRRVATRTLQVATVDSTTPSPFAASLLFSYVANYIYDGDAPLAERRAQALSVDQTQLRELLGTAELRELLDPSALDDVEGQLQAVEPSRRVRSVDGLHDLLIRLGDLTRPEIEARCQIADVDAALVDLERAGRILSIRIAGEDRFIAVEDVARYRDALAVPVPSSIPESLREPVRDPAGDLALRYARTHGPFTTADFASRLGLGSAVADVLLTRLADESRLIQGEFRPGGTGVEWIDADVLRRIRGRSLARLRREVEPVDTETLGRFLLSWHGIGAGRRGLEALLDAIEQLQGAPLPFSVLEREMLPARVADYEPSMLDTLMAAGEVVWIGVEPLGERDGRIALYLTDHFARLTPPIATTAAERPGREGTVLAHLRAQGASFFAAIHESSGGGYPPETVAAIWDLVWKGLVTNDTLHALRALTSVPASKSSRRTRPQPFRSRRLVPPTAEGRWALVERPRATRASTTEWSTALAHQLLARHGIVTRETTAAESVSGGFAGVYQVLKAMEETGRVRRGYFVSGLGGAQFAMPAALELLRSMREPAETPVTAILAATDPACAYGSLIKWPTSGWLEEIASRRGLTVDTHADTGRGPTRSTGSLVVMVDGRAAGYLRRGEREIILGVPVSEPFRSSVTRAVVRALVDMSAAREEGQRGLLIAEIDNVPATSHPAAPLFVEGGFLMTAMGLQLRHRRAAAAPADGAAERGDQ